MLHECNASISIYFEPEEIKLKKQNENMRKNRNTHT